MYALSKNCVDFTDKKLNKKRLLKRTFITTAPAEYLIAFRTRNLYYSLVISFLQVLNTENRLTDEIKEMKQVSKEGMRFWL